MINHHAGWGDSNPSKPELGYMENFTQMLRIPNIADPEVLAKIEKRLDFAAEADFVIVIYNPKSKKRDWQLTKAKELILKHRNKNTPVGIVTGAMRENQKVTITKLENIDKEEVGMQSILFVGSTASVQYLDFIFTPRGYAQKYNF